VVADMESGDPERMQWTNLKITTQEGEKRIVDAKNIPLIDQNQMISTVINVTTEKEAKEERKLVLESISDAFYAIDGNWDFTYFNNEAEKLLEKSSEDVLGKNIWDVFAPAKETELYEKYNEVMKTSKSKPPFEYFYPPLETWFEVSVYAREEGLSVFFKNIDDRKEWERELKNLNKQLEERAEELEATNEELEQFAYVASHDLQEPLRMVTSFLSRLEKKYHGQLDNKAQQYIDFAVDGAQRMRRIILDLLNYSRMNQQELEREEVDLNMLLEDIIKLDQSAISESNASISWDDLPTVNAARTPIRQVFENLINNGIKYRKPDEDPEITITAVEQNDYWQFAVSDNGIGIKEEFQDNIFAIFKRLHTQDEYSGTGIGLSVCQKIVEKHGGKICVDSKEGEGSTFYFTIKKNEQA
jgi:PAS domain S-box-containing protein